MAGGEECSPGASLPLLRPPTLAKTPDPSDLALASSPAPALSCPCSHSWLGGRPQPWSAAHSPAPGSGENTAEEGRDVTFPHSFVLEADTGENPKGPSAPSQFHHKYPDRASGTKLIVQAPAAAPPETALPAVGGRRPRQETPPSVPQGPWPPHRPAALDLALAPF